MTTVWIEDNGTRADAAAMERINKALDRVHHRIEVVEFSEGVKMPAVGYPNTVDPSSGGRIIRRFFRREIPAAD